MKKQKLRIICFVGILLVLGFGESLILCRGIADIADGNPIGSMFIIT